MIVNVTSLTKTCWSTVEPRPLDLNGPDGVLFRRFDEKWVERPAVDLFGEIVAQHPDRIACEDIESRLTFSQMWTACRHLAAAIEVAAPPGRAVGVLLPNEASYPVAVLACLVTARPCVMIDRYHPQDRVATIVTDAGLAAVVLKRADIRDGYLLPAGVRALPIDDALEARTAPDGLVRTPMASDAASFVVYTSGSTGRPKGIVLSQRSVLHRATELVNSVHLRPDDKVLSLASPSTIGGLQQIFEVMLSGASLVKLDLQRIGLGRVVETVSQRKITMMFSTPAVWRSVAQMEGAREALASLRCIQSSGDTLLRVDYDLLRSVLPSTCDVLSAYGATEAPALLQWFISSPPEDEARVPAGYPLPGLEFALLDEQDQIVADGAAGELVIRSRYTSLGLWHDGSVLPGPFERDAEAPEWQIYRTGDLVRRLPDGLFVVLGRRDRQIKIRGNRVELAEIETVLRRIPAVLDAAVIARRLDKEPVLLAFVVLRESKHSVAIGDLRGRLASTLPAYMRPHHVFMLDALPLQPGRKIDEEALLAHFACETANPAPMQAPSPASPQAVDMVNKVWRRILGRSPRDGQSFEEAGGDSLRLLQLIFYLEHLADRTLPMERFHGRLSAEQFALELDHSLAGADDELPASTLAVFLFPPGGGGDAYLASFRAVCAKRMAIRQVNYPNLRALARRSASFDAIATHTVRQITTAKPSGPLVLAGYSDGGDVAYAAAQHLLAAGRQVALLCILDTDATGLQYESPALPRRSIADQLHRYVRALRRGDWRRLVRAMLPSKLFASPLGRALLRFSLAVRPPMPASLAFVASLHSVMELFHDLHIQWFKTMQAWPMSVPILLFRSQERRPGAPEDMGWRGRTANLSIIPVPGDHSTMLSSEFGELFCDEVVRRAHEDLGLIASPALR